MAINKRLLVKPPSTGITPSEHFGVVLYEGDGSSSHSINGGKFGAAAYIDSGAASYINLGAGSSFASGLFNGKSTFSVSIWFRKSSSSLGYIFNDYANNSLNVNISILADGRMEIFTRYSSGDTSYNSTTTYDDDNWHHVVVTLDQTTGVRKSYIDGTLVDTQTTSSNSWNGDSDQRITIGALYYTPGNYYQSSFDGKIDQLRVFTKVLSSSEVSTLYAETLATSTSLDPLSEDTTDTLQVLGDSSCIATYRFENDETDLSGNYDGTGTEIQYAAGRYGQAGDFNGSTSEVTTSDMTGLDSTTISLSAWVYFDAVGVENTIFSRFGGCGNHSCYQIILRTTSSNVWSFATYDGTGNGDSLTSTDTVSTGEWYHVVIVADGTNKKIYVNNEQVASSTVAFSVNTSSGEGLNIGGRGDFAASSTSRMNGRIDQVRTFSKALSASEVTTLYNENSLVASYRFEGNANDDTRNYDGTASNVTYEYGLNFTPDFVWTKARTSPYSHNLQDSTRGGGSSNALNPNLNLAAGTYGIYGFVDTFDTGGFTTGTGSTNNVHVNANSEDYVAWCFKANGGTTSSNTDGSITSTVQVNEDAGFSIISWTGTGAQGTIGHGLSAAPEVILSKRLDSANNWTVYQKDLGLSHTTYPNWLYLNFTSEEQASGSSVNHPYYQAPSSTLIYQNTGTSELSNVAGAQYISYCFASVASYSSFGSYTGNGSTNGPIVETGFEPAFIMTKQTNTASNWVIVDNKRSTINPRDKGLRPNSDVTEATVSNNMVVDFLSNGFQLKQTSGANDNGGTFIYMAFAADPDTEAPTVAKSFSTVAYTGNSSTQSIEGLGFSPNLVWIKGRNNTYVHGLYDTIRGSLQRLRSNGTQANENVPNSLTSFDSDGFTLGSNIGQNQSANNYVAWAFKADDNEPTIYGGSALAVYKFEDNANDVRGNYNATATNITYVTGKFNKAASFVESNSSEIDFSNSIHGSSFSMSFWMKATDMGAGTTATAYSIYSAYVDVNNYFRPVLYGDGSLLLLTKYSGTFKSNLTSSGIITENTWHHIVFNFTPTDTKAYVDGVNIGTFPSYDPISFTSKAFGTDRGNPDFTGDIDQLRFYDAALTQENVTALYNETASDNDDLTFGAPGEVVISANANAGFSIVKYEGDGLRNHKVPHGLSAAPELVFIKNLDQAVTWQLFGSTFFDRMQFDTGGDDGNYPLSYSSTTITLPQSGQHANNEWNASGNNYIAYCWHSVAGYSKIGSYSGNNTGQTITTGFQPDFLMLKKTNVTSEWWIMDSVRGTTNNLEANTSDAENTGISGAPTFVSTGFNFSGSTFNETGTDWIYMAFKIN